MEHGTINQVRYLVRAAILTDDGLKGKACLVDRVGVTNDELRITNVGQEFSPSSLADSGVKTLFQAISFDGLQTTDGTPTEESLGRPDG